MHVFSCIKKTVCMHTHTHTCTLCKFSLYSNSLCACTCVPIQTYIIFMPTHTHTHIVCGCCAYMSISTLHVYLSTHPFQLTKKYERHELTPNSSSNGSDWRASQDSWSQQLGAMVVGSKSDCWSWHAQFTPCMYSHACMHPLSEFVLCVCGWSLQDHVICEHKSRDLWAQITWPCNHMIWIYVPKTTHTNTHNNVPLLSQMYTNTTWNMSSSFLSFIAQLMSIYRMLLLSWTCPPSQQDGKTKKIITWTKFL